MNLNQQVALVTGANRGIGLAIVHALLRQGIGKVYAAARHVARLPQFDDARVVPLTLDVTHSAQVQAGALWLKDPRGFEQQFAA